MRPEDVAARFRAENEREAHALTARRAIALEIGRAIAAALVAADPRLARVWGFGSTFEPRRPYRRDSDIDLALESITGGESASASASASAERLAARIADEITRKGPAAGAPGFKIDLIDLSDCRPGIAAAVRERGVVLAQGPLIEGSVR